MNNPKIKCISKVFVLLLQSTTLYTTFDEILDDTLPDQQDNRLIEVLGEPLMVRYFIHLFLNNLSESFKGMATLMITMFYTNDLNKP